MMPSLMGHVTSCRTQPSAGFNKLNTTYKAVLETQVVMAVLHDSCCHCGVPGGRHNLIELTEEEEESKESKRNLDRFDPVC